MNRHGQLYSHGIWMAKPVTEGEFIRAWEEFALWTSEHQSGVGNGLLLQGLEHPSRFISFGPWEITEKIRERRSRPEFAAFLARARELCEEIQPGTFVAVARGLAEPGAHHRMRGTLWTDI